MTEQNDSTLCSFVGCDRLKDSRGLCLKHYKRLRRTKEFVATPRPVYDEICSIEGCESKQKKRGYCDKHYRRIQRNGNIELVRAPAGQIKIFEGYEMIINDFVHILKAEKALGRKLPKNAMVHHVNEIRSDNRNENLVICPDKAYHNMLHARMRAYDACGNANWLKCGYCKTYDNPENGTTRKSREGWHTKLFYHKSCAAKHMRDKKHASKILEQATC